MLRRVVSTLIQIGLRSAARCARIRRAITSLLMRTTTLTRLVTTNFQTTQMRCCRVATLLSFLGGIGAGGGEESTALTRHGLAGKVALRHVLRERSAGRVARVARTMAEGAAVGQKLFRLSRATLIHAQFLALSAGGLAGRCALKLVEKVKRRGRARKMGRTTEALLVTATRRTHCSAITSHVLLIVISSPGAHGELAPRPALLTATTATRHATAARLDPSTGARTVTATPLTMGFAINSHVRTIARWALGQLGLFARRPARFLPSHTATRSARGAQ